ncbi:MAG: NUDIX hydrolase [Caldilineaceae bacterium]
MTTKPTTNREIRYQGAIVRDHHLLLIRQHEYATGRSYWLFPGGGREAGETEEDCVRREMHEETNLVVTVERLLFEHTENLGVYRLRRTFLCAIVAGIAAPGYEPEEGIADQYSIVEVGWFDLRDAQSWGELVRSDAITYPQMLQVQRRLGY